MNTQNQVILSLGSNLVNRLENIQLAIQSLHNQIGTVIKVSALYETPSWGFESDAFYNCALIMQTAKPAEQLLDEILQLELELGRVRSQQEGYKARIIDIDVIAFNEEIIQTDKLKIPHPHMQNRKFVLLPMRDLNLDWRHPILQKYLPELVALAEDKSQCKEIMKLETPLQKINLQQYNYIAIEGNIGAGKTTLSSKISEDFNAKLVLERFADNPFLPKFYEDQNRYAFPLEMSFLADRYQQLTDDLAQFDLFKDFVVADYHIFKSLIFAKVTLAEDEFRLYKTMFDIIHKEMPKPDLYVYLYQNTEQLLENIKKRGRSYEMQIPAEYLEKINQGYLDFIKTQTQLNVLIIDVSNKDFVNFQEDYIFILNEIQAKLV
ncbi:2-amino-4-hydroxy-6-hydroxymethyldihydropteridine diphosphokinase [Flavobacterium filum]|uniref:2-amino-4-hydroxy-6- hydroxymethyldihydropteridine diphosphokinase n=1 Tax=Flavobacterium filum TaxID=370974 RepID=UPI0023F58F23|nr:2-amino-4-hydroxy-6-hydroxymethyldihydropteridine diphosphokinase [Flavobacterium filum]